jgi:hypothetical protein
MANMIASASPRKSVIEASAEALRAAKRYSPRRGHEECQHCGRTSEEHFGREHFCTRSAETLRWKLDVVQRLQDTYHFLRRVKRTIIGRGWNGATNTSAPATGLGALRLKGGRVIDYAKWDHLDDFSDGDVLLKAQREAMQWDLHRRAEDGDFSSGLELDDGGACHEDHHSQELPLEKVNAPTETPGNSTSVCLATNGKETVSCGVGQKDDRGTGRLCAEGSTISSKDEGCEHSDAKMDSDGEMDKDNNMRGLQDEDCGLGRVCPGQRLELSAAEGPDSPAAQRLGFPVHAQQEEQEEQRVLATARGDPSALSKQPARKRDWTALQARDVPGEPEGRGARAVEAVGGHAGPLDGVRAALDVRPVGARQESVSRVTLVNRALEHAPVSDLYAAEVSTKFC